MSAPDAAPPMTPRHAATVLLLREGPEGVEVLLTQRHANLAFMGGMWVFPGGALAPADMSADALACVPEDAQRRCSQFKSLLGEPLTRAECIGLAIAAFRETFEETGVLLATGTNGRHCGDDVWERVQAQRRAIVSTPALFLQLLQEEQLLLDIDRLVYWAHWITPSNAPRRFDTRFFLTVAPEAQAARIDTIEAVDHAWIRPRAALEAAERGDTPVSHPTLYNLMELDAVLRECGSLDAALKHVRGREIAPILPKVIREGGTTIVLPWDADYSSLPGAEAPPALRYPATLRALPSRMTSRS